MVVISVNKCAIAMVGQYVKELCLNKSQTIILFPLMHLIYAHNETVARSPKGQVLLVLLWGFAECGNRKALRLKAQGVYSCKRPSLNVDNNAASAVLCNGLIINYTSEVLSS